MNVWLIAAMSADGFIAESPDQRSLDWTSKEDTRFFIDKTKEAGCLIMGSTTFETIGKPLPGRLTVVMRRGGGDSVFPPLHKGGAGEVVYTDEDPRAILDALAHSGYESVVIAGGSQIYSLFIREGLVTDFFLTIEPVLFGEGVPLATGFDRVNLRLVDSTLLGRQAVLLHYSHHIMKWDFSRRRDG